MTDLKLGKIATILFLCAAAVLAAVSLAGCSSVPPVVKIGIVGPFEGYYREVGYDVIYSARMAIREENAREDIGDYRVALVALDDFGDTESAQSTARSLVADPGVIAVVGHWLPDTTSSAAPVYENAGLALVQGGSPPFIEVDPSTLPEKFRTDYAKITPFDEEAGIYAGAGYDSVGLILKAIAEADVNDMPLDRRSIADILTSLTFDGVTGSVYLP
ncbi:MAG: ABC transporter substrate-binding protein [Candidatus Promineifilaceae bacterium]